LHPVYKDRPTTAYGFCGDGALLERQPESDETLSHLAIGLFPDHFVVRLAPPEINPADLEELPRGSAKEVDQGAGVGALGGFGGNAQKEFLKGFVGVRQRTGFRRRRRIAFNYLQNVTVASAGFSLFSQVIESNGKLSRHLILSQGKWVSGCLTVKSREKRGYIDLTVRIDSTQSRR